MNDSSLQKRDRRDAVLEFLEKRDWDGFRNWTRTDRSPWRILMPLTLNSDPLLRWRAIEAVGRIAAWKAAGIGGIQRNLEPVREMLRRLFWGMNDESGNSHWSAPDVIAEILVNVPELIEEFAAPLLDHLDSEPYRHGVYRAIVRIAALKSDPFLQLTDLLTKSLHFSDPLIRGCSLLALVRISKENALHLLQNPVESAFWRGDSEPFRLYDFCTGSFQVLTLASIGAEILAQNR